MDVRVGLKKAERWRIDAFELWCWRRLLRVPWTARRSNQSILKISPGCSLQGMMLKLKLLYFGHLMWRVDSLEKIWCWEGLGAGGKGDDRGWDCWMASPTRWTWVWVNSGSWWWTGRPGLLRFMVSQGVRHDWVTELNWTPVLEAITKWWRVCQHIFMTTIKLSKSPTKEVAKGSKRKKCMSNHSAQAHYLLLILILKVFQRYKILDVWFTIDQGIIAYDL